MTLLELYHISEMARTRGDAAWKVLDWAASQQGDFTIRDAYRVYAAAGGESTEQQFATIFNKWVAKYDPRSSKDRYRDRDRYGLSQSRPLVITRQGRRGKGGQATYQWGLDGPLRQAPEGEEPEVEEDDLGEALDKLEGYMGGIELRKQMARWKALPDMNAVMRDVTRLPARMHAAAMLVASQHLVASGRAAPEEVGDMEARLDARAGQQAPTGTPFAPGRPKPNLPQDGRPGFRPRPPTPPPPTPEPEPEADAASEWDDDSADRTRPDAVSPFADETDAQGRPVPDQGDETEGETPEGSELRAVLRYGENLSRGRVTWSNGEAVVTDEAGHRIPPDSGVELQVLGDEQFDGEHAGMMEWLASGWPNLLDPPSEGGPDLEAEFAEEGPAPEDGGERGADEAAPEGDVIDTGDYPDFLPPANSGGSPGERAMYRLVDLAQNGGAEVSAIDPLWDIMEANDDEASAAHQIRALFSGRGYSKEFLRDALEVSREVISGQGESEAAPADEFPTWAPPAVSDGTPAEQAMYRLVSDHGVNADDPLWDAVTHATDETDVRRIVMANWKGRPKQGFRDAVTVASFGLENAFEVPEEYEQPEGEPEAGDEDDGEEPTDDADVTEPEEAPAPRASGATPSWLPRPNEDGSRAEAAMYDILSDLPKASGFEGFDAGAPIFDEIRSAANIEDAYSVILRNSVPRIMVKKFLTVARAVFDHDGRDPETGEKVREAVRRRLVNMMEDAMDDACEDDPVPDPSKRGPVGVGRLLPMYGMDEGPNLDPIDFAPKSGLARIMRVTRRNH